MDNDAFYRTELARRLREFAQQRQVAEEQVVSLRVRPLQPDGSVAYVAWPSHEQAISLAGVSKVPESVPFFGAEYLPGGFKAYQLAHADLLWIPHETGLEIIGLVLGVIGAVEPTVKGIKWLVNRLMGKPERDIYQPYSVSTVQLEVRVLRSGQVYQQVILERIETLVDDEKGFLHTVEERIRTVTAYRAEPVAADDRRGI